MYNTTRMTVFDSMYQLFEIESCNPFVKSLRSFDEVQQIAILNEFENDVISLSTLTVLHFIKTFSVSIKTDYVLMIA